MPQRTRAQRDADEWVINGSKIFITSGVLADLYLIAAHRPRGQGLARHLHCVQLHGGMGYMRESPIERMARDARVLSIGGGATEVMLEEAAKRL